MQNNIIIILYIRKTGDECAQDVMQYFYESVPELKEFDNPRQSLSEIQDPIYCPSKALHVYVSITVYSHVYYNAFILRSQRLAILARTQTLLR